MALSDSEVCLIRTTWAPIRSSPTTWPKLFLILFAEVPEAQKKFKAFENIPIDELANNKRLKAHAASVVSLISGYVDFLDDPETMVEMIKSTANRHHGRNIPLLMFEALGIVLIKWLKEVQGEAINDEAVAVWTKLYAALVSIVKDQYAELDKAPS